MSGERLLGSGYRLPPQPREWIDRDAPLDFHFEGSAYSGFSGDTITSALAAHGVRMLGRSFKYHRPRGVYSLANHDVNALMQDAQRLNIRADVTPVWQGADLYAVNTLGGLNADRYRVMDRLSAFFPVGFYYKTFHKPRWLFPFWERRLRNAAGLGKVDLKHPRVRTPKDYAFCDVLVIGGGPAGLSAALSAAKASARVMLVDENPRLGGSLTYQYGGKSDALSLAEPLLSQVQSEKGIEVRLSTVAAGYYADHWIALVDDRRLTKLRARSVIVASGCFEIPAVFRNNDLPGVMLASAAQRLIFRFAVKPCHRALVLAANAEGYQACLDLMRAGVEVAGLADLRAEGEPSALGTEVAEAGVPIYAGYAVREARPASGKRGIRGALICPWDGAGNTDTRKAVELRCDGIAMSVGYAAADSLICQSGGKMAYSTPLEQFVPQALPPGVFCAGRVNGVHQLDAQIADGRRSGLQAAKYLGLASGEGSAVDSPAMDTARARPSHPYPIVHHPKGKDFFDLDEDVQFKDLENSAQEGFDQMELLKRYSTFGMGPSQGKLTNVNVLRALAKIKGQSIAETGTTTARPFFHPVALSHLAGRGFHPERKTSLHHLHDQRGARYLLAGDWLRPAYYPKQGRSREELIAAEALAVRTTGGLIDLGTLGKISIMGRDAVDFIERVYTGKFATLKVGMSRYALMCDESGVIIDDGVVVRRAEDRFYVTTTTTASSGIFAELQRWALLWGKHVVLSNETGHRGAINLAGPLSRQVLAPLTDIDLSEKRFPYLAAREGHVLGVPVMAVRVGFVGELGYEIHMPIASAARIWTGILEAGAALGIEPFGVEAQRVLRLEKGHAIISQDTDGLTTPREAAMTWAVKDDKPFFVGQRSLRILSKKAIDRTLVGFTMAAEGPIPKECHLVIDGDRIVGRVTSVVRSPTLNQVIGLAYVHPSQSSPGTVIRIRIDGGALVEGRVSTLPFYDPENSRQKAGAPDRSAAA